jgi:TolB-like protein/class 3 adenylate cyclase/cytochrome c-type biogenesis protein CcmH/NrfG
MIALRRRQVPTTPTPQLAQSDLRLEIAHLLLIDIVGYSKLLVNEQIESVQELGRVVRSTECFRKAEASGKLIRVPTGDGMALLFFQSPEEPVCCALEISKQLRENSKIRVRMGIHSGPVNQVRDVNDTLNVAGTGINIAQRVMDCGDADHILLSKHVADDLSQYRHWQPYLHDFGECEVKYGLRLHIINLYKDGLGNPALPEKLTRGKRWKQTSRTTVRPVTASGWPRSGLIAALSLSILIVCLSLVIFLRRPMPVSSASSANASIPEKSIAVLPFENMSEDKQNAYFTDGVQDEILTNLSKVADLKVISRTSVMQYRSGADRNLREIAKTLGVAHVVEGSVQRVGDRVRVSAQLIDARTDTHLWGEHYDRDLANVFAIESELAEQIVAKLRAKLSPEEKGAIEHKPTDNLAAYDLYLRAKPLINTTAFNARASESLLEAVHLLEQATALDEAFLLAYCQLATAHDQIYFFGVDHTPARLAAADAAIRAALRLDPKSGEAHLALAQHLYLGYRDYDHARAELALVIPALPNEPFALILSAFINRRQANWEKSTQELQHALELDPRNLLILQQISLSYEHLRRYADMAATLDRALEISPKDASTRVHRAAVAFKSRADLAPLRSTIDAVLAEDKSAAASIANQSFDLALCQRDPGGAERALAALPQKGYVDESFNFPRPWCEALVANLRRDNPAARRAFTRARTEVEQVVRQEPTFAEELAILGLINAALGNKEEAIREGRRAEELLPVTKDSINGALVMKYLALIYAWTGEKDFAFEQLTKATKLPGGLSYGQLRLHPYWDSLRGDRRFEKIVASLATDPKP